MNDDQQNRAFINGDLANCVPALLPGFVIDAAISKSMPLCLAMFARSLVRVPFEPHRTTSV
jgi:hypothetical protein